MERHAAAPETAPVILPGSARPVTTAIYDRQQLRPLRRYRGPAVITEYSATTVVPASMSFAMDRAGNLVITVQKETGR